MKELNFLRKRKTNTASAVVVLLASILFSSCSQSGPEPINLHKDDCDNCKMTISDKRFACELVTEKGRAYKFDDLSCLTAYKTENSDKMNNAKFYINDYLSPNDLVLHTTLSFVEGEEIASPMGGNIAGFTNKDSASVYLTIWGAESIAWEEIK